MAQGKTRTDLDRLFRCKDRLLRCIRICAANGQGIVRVWIAFIQPDRLQSGVEAFSDIVRRLVTPAIRDNAGTDATEPDVSFRKLGIDPACFPEQLASLQMTLTPNVVEMPGALSHQVPGRYVSAVSDAEGSMRGAVL